MRKAFSDTLTRAAAENEKIVFITGDLGFGVFDDFRKKFGPRYLNVGVAEAQVVNTAVGLALEGWRPIIYSIAPFVTARPYEQIRFGIAYHRLPILVIGAGGGFTYAKSGVTHHAPDDLLLMSALPGMTVVSPGGPDEIRSLMPQLLALSGPSYMRVGKFGEPDVGCSAPAIVGKARRLFDGKGMAIITVGDIVTAVKPAVETLRSKENLHPALYHFHTVKPLDTEALREISAGYELAVIVEECVPQGGLFNEVCRWKAECDSPLKLSRLGAPDAFILGSPGREELRKRIGVDAAAVNARCRAYFKK